MRRLLEDALSSGDVVQLEKAIISAQNTALASLKQRRESNYLNDLMLRCRKALVQHLEECGSLLKPLRRACRNLDEEALTDALRRVHLATSELRRYMRTDIQQAETLHSRMLCAAEEARKLLNGSDWRELEHFLDANTAILPDRTVVALMRRREALFTQRHRTHVDPVARMTGLSPAPFYAGSSRRDVDEEATGTISQRMIEHEEESGRCVLIKQEHAQRVLCLKSVLDATALLLSHTDGQWGTSMQYCAAQVGVPVPRQETQCSSPLSGLTNSDNRFFPPSTAATPNVSPIKPTLLVYSASRADQRPTAVGTSAAAGTANNISDSILTRGTVSFVSQEPHAVVSPGVLAKLSALMEEEEICRHDVEGGENFERNVFLLPMAARSVLLTRVFPRRKL
ncbi:hypothetical protein MOQ_004247 [Trypanosoma cruzi marinkellei]|uniref:Trichohyalin n=1 Tax=Trypanosoma cruzi marinkellei TaxID=85056 RepID=K2NSF5_TRYCR|nr:hypothetical protein MOQ_004247 [Trypanosoma cruzi marinkellei]